VTLASVTIRLALRSKKEALNQAVDERINDIIK
jgi:hypothetical protein